jgi:hypothetical protein
MKEKWEEAVEAEVVAPEPCVGSCGGGDGGEGLERRCWTRKG